MRFYQQLKERTEDPRNGKEGRLNPLYVGEQKGPNSDGEWGPGEGMVSRPFPTVGMAEEM